jgi:hypothetical protein
LKPKDFSVPPDLAEASQLISTDASALVQSARSYALHARAQGTLTAYRKHWAAFTAWCAKEGFCELPAAPQTFALFLAARADEGRKVATLSLALSAISQAHFIRKPRPSSARCHRRYPRAEHWKVPASAPWLASAIERVQFSRAHRFSVADSP